MGADEEGDLSRPGSPTAPPLDRLSGNLVSPGEGAPEVSLPAVRRALALVRAGQLRRAASSLLQKGIHDPTPEVVGQLGRLHLSAPDHPLPARPQQAPSPSFAPFTVRDYLRERAPRGSAPGLSGWTESLLLPLVEDAHLLLAVTSFLEDIANGRIDSASRERLLSCRLIPVKKKDDGVRPIAVSEVFLRAATSLSLRLVAPEALSHLLTPIQLGLGSAGGTEAVIHRVQALLEQHADHVLLSLDFANGFNSMFRHIMLERLYALPELSQVCAWPTYAMASAHLLISLDAMAWSPALCRKEALGRVVSWGRYSFAWACNPS